MSASTLDVLAYAKDLEGAVLTRVQAEAIARGTIQMQAQHFDSLVTREHFDLTVERFEHRFEVIDERFESIDKRFDGIDKRFDRLEGRIGNLESMKLQVSLLTWMMGLVIVVLVVPQLQAWFSAI